MMKTLRRKFIAFAMSAVTILLVVLVGAINGLNWMALEGQSDRVLDTLVNADGMFKHMDFPNQPPIGRPLNMDTMKSARFFTVRTDESGRIFDVNIEQISSVSREQAVSYARQVTKSGGRIDGYKYEVKTVGTSRLIVFMDISGQRDNFITVLVVSSAIALVCWLAVLLFAILVSGKIIRPVIAGVEKQKQFITNAGHELKTPLAIIQSNNDAMTLIHGENKYNANIKAQVQRLSGLMSNLLMLSKLDEEVRFPTEPVNISELILGTLPSYEDMAAAGGIALTAAITPNITMQTHRETFMQLVTVLLDNAVKYTPEGGEIRVALTRENNRIHFTQENTCPMPREKDPERLFERFYRGDSSRTQESAASGYGIGLSAARAIAETFGGKLTAEYSTSEMIRFSARF